ncbi:MAG: hypothetical protein Q9220_006795 [cf. Caloplaca sp. 1 TL-2023]
MVAVERTPEIGPDLAAQLNLHTPFRSFATRGADAQDEAPTGNRQHKRRRIHSATSSYLEPARVIEDRDRVFTEAKDAKSDERQPRKKCRNVSISTTSSSIANLSPRKPAKTYEKRSRYKTREDKYELKQDKRRTKAKADEGNAREKPRGRRRKGRERSGAALMHNFSAKNVEPERLTVSSVI